MLKHIINFTLNKTIRKQSKTYFPRVYEFRKNFSNNTHETSKSFNKFKKCFIFVSAVVSYKNIGFTEKII